MLSMASKHSLPARSCLSETNPSCDAQLDWGDASGGKINPRGVALSPFKQALLNPHPFDGQTIFRFHDCPS
jgi:hypothetical protein